MSGDLSRRHLLLAGGAPAAAPRIVSVSTATISSVTPAIGVPGTEVIIAGSYFGSEQFSGQVWLGTTPATVQSWSDTQIVALVAAGALSGNAQVVQNGVLSNAFPFVVDTLHLASVWPKQGAAGTSVTLDGSGFGASQGSGIVWLGNVAGEVVSWSDAEVVATVASAAGSGVARIQQNGVWSNAVAFTVPAADGSTLALVPSLLNLMVGDTHTIQALNGAGQPVTGLTWASSDPTVVSLSSDDPPLLTALAAGHVTIAAGTASADVTVSDPAILPGGVLPVGTVLWSYPGDYWPIFPAVPSPSGAADMFAISTGTVTAIRSDGTTAWIASLETADNWWADFQGGLILQKGESIVRLDGATGQPITLLPAPSDVNVSQSFAAIHADGTVFVIQNRMIPYDPPPCGDQWGHCPPPPPPPPRLLRYWVWTPLGAGRNSVW
jgi:hypothetical protein